jgi:transcriptional regulator with XRE-family HTH domain
MGRKKNAPSYSDAAVFLGQAITKLRTRQGLTRMQLGRAINETEQRVGLFESGAFIPLDTLEAIGEALDSPIPKKIIRRISDLRYLEKQSEIDQPELLDWYRAAFPEDEA